MKPISEFIRDVSLPKAMPTLVDWRDLLRSEGYYPVEFNCTVQLTSYGHWQDIIAWCNEMFGENHFTWTGQTMWFESSESAMMFILRWR
jgi:hypothetical protein